MDQTFQYMIDREVAAQKSYPDDIRPVGKCRYTLNMTFTDSLNAQGYLRDRIESYSLLSAIVQQPVSVAVDQN